MRILLYILLPAAGLILGWFIRWLYARFQLSAAEQKASRVLDDAVKEAEAQKKEILLEAKEQLIRERNQQERETAAAAASCSTTSAALPKRKRRWTAGRGSS